MISLILILFFLSSISCQSWIPLSPFSTLPSVRYQHSAVYTNANTMIVFGGGSSSNYYLNDLWQYYVSTNLWIQLNPSGTLPSGRRQHSAIYTNSNNMIIFGGQSNQVLSDLWQYNISNNSWLQLNPSGIPPAARKQHSAIYTNSNTMIIFGGTSTITYNDVWQYNIGSNSWFQLNFTGLFPVGTLSSAIYIKPSMVLIFSGTNMLNYIWQYHLDFNLWSSETTQNSSPLTFSPVIPVSQSDIFGFSTSFQTWQFNSICNSWFQSNTIGTLPSSRTGATLIYTNSNSVILFGGMNNTAQNDIWMFSNGCVFLDSCDTCTSKSSNNCEWCLECFSCVPVNSTCEDSVQNTKYCPIITPCEKYQNCNECLNIPGQCSWCLDSNGCIPLQNQDTCQNHFDFPKYCPK